MKLRLIPFAVMAAIVASCSTEDEIAVNPDPRGDAISFSTAVGHSRATETTITNLGDFRVVAKGIHPNGNIYENYLIGSAESGGELAKKEGTNIWKLDRNVYWPTSTPTAVFWAYTFAQSSGTNTAVLPDGVEFSFDKSDSKKAKLTGFTPVKNVLTPQSETGSGDWDDGKDQTDMLVAFTSQKRSENAYNVGLTFHHTLSQIRIQAKSADKVESDHRIVKIKGAWLVNAKDKADFTAAYSWNTTEGKATVTDEWENHTFKNNDGFSAYGSFFREPVLLGKINPDEPKLLVDESLMLIPQKLTAWNKNQDDAGAEADNNGGAYILLLCRVELEHDGTRHDDSKPEDVEDVYVKDGKHYHQQFPVNKANKYNKAEYGFVCVPVGIEFVANTKYLFTLDICGAASGAGNYPPDLNDKFKALVPKAANDDTKYDRFKPWTDEDFVNLEIVERGDVKNVGDAVLDAPIQFEVKVSAWPDNWTDGGAQF